MLLTCAKILKMQVSKRTPHLGKFMSRYRDGYFPQPGTIPSFGVALKSWKCRFQNDGRISGNSWAGTGAVTFAKLALYHLFELPWNPENTGFKTHTSFLGNSGVGTWPLRIPVWKKCCTKVVWISKAFCLVFLIFSIEKNLILMVTPTPY